MAKPKPKANPAPDSDAPTDAMRAFEEAARKLLAGKPPRKRERGAKTRRGKGS
jgi:hypothetical protein